MSKSDKSLIIAGLCFIIIGIFTGMIAAHYLAPLGIEDKQIESFSTGSTYLFYNGLGFLVLSSLEAKFDFQLKNHFRTITLGVILFAGSIFALIMLPVIDINISKYIWFVTPIGGALIIIGWLTILIKYLQTYK
ncbi:MAG: DUF423 domain-containing protein [Brumimicrobium sp.]